MMKMSAVSGKIKKVLHDKRVILALILLIAGLILVSVSKKDTGGDSEQNNAVSGSASFAVLSGEFEERIEKLCESIDGIDKAHVMLTLDTSEEYVYAADSEKNGDSYKSEMVLIDGGDGTVKLYAVCPRVRGVAVVCTGGDKASVKKTVTECLSAALGIPSTKISVAGAK